MCNSKVIPSKIFIHTDVLNQRRIELSDIKRLVLDVLKPHHPSIVELSRKLSGIGGIIGVNCTIDEVDQDTESIKITIEGNSINYEKVEKVIKEFGAVIHSVDSVSTGKKLVDSVTTPQD
jgi:hypothetical protein